jgi:thymidine kinase
MKKTPIKRGKLTVICGPMFSGKTKKLIHIIRVFHALGKRVFVFKPKIDTRYSTDHVIVGHDKDMANALLIDHDKPDEIITILNKENNFPIEIIIDEINFFEPEKTVPVIVDLLNRGCNVTVAGADYTYTKDQFGATLTLYQMADIRMKLFAVCEKCGGKAIYSERTSGSTKMIDVGAKDKYIAVCKKCFVKYTG